MTESPLPPNCFMCLPGTFSEAGVRGNHCICCVWVGKLCSSLGPVTLGFASAIVKLKKCFYSKTEVLILFLFMYWNIESCTRETSHWHNLSCGFSFCYVFMWCFIHSTMSWIFLLWWLPRCFLSVSHCPYSTVVLLGFSAQVLNCYPISSHSSLILFTAWSPSCK